MRTSAGINRNTSARSFSLTRVAANPSLSGSLCSSVPKAAVPSLLSSALVLLPRQAQQLEDGLVEAEAGLHEDAGRLRVAPVGRSTRPSLLCLPQVHVGLLREHIHLLLVGLALLQRGLKQLIIGRLDGTIQEDLPVVPVLFGARDLSGSTISSNNFSNSTATTNLKYAVLGTKPNVIVGYISAQCDGPTPLSQSILTTRFPHTLVV
jgi:hypothetical protein